MQFLISKLEENKYVYFIREKCESQIIQDIFWTHPTSLKLFNNFSNVLIMDSTYKTNLYRMPLFEIVRVTSTDMTYSIGFAFMTLEKEDNFTWALQMLVKLLKPNSDMPTVIVAEREERPFSPKKDSNQHNSILCDTLVKANEEFEDLVEHLDDLILLDGI